MVPLLTANVILPLSRSSTMPWTLEILGGFAGFFWAASWNARTSPRMVPRHSPLMFENRVRILCSVTGRRAPVVDQYIPEVAGTGLNRVEDGWLLISPDAGHPACRWILDFLHQTSGVQNRPCRRGMVLQLGPVSRPVRRGEAG